MHVRVQSSQLHERGPAMLQWKSAPNNSAQEAEPLSMDGSFDRSAAFNTERWIMRLSSIVPKATALGGPALAVQVAVGASGRADETVNVALMDQGMESMRMELSTERVKVGNVTFNVANKSQNLVHEFIVFKSDRPIEALPYEADQKEVNEDAIEAHNEIEDIDPGKSGTITLKLVPGTYILLCNKPGHFKSGMVHTLIVAP